MVLLNGKIFTANDAQLWAQALAITRDRVTAVGDTAAVAALAGASTRRIDLAGRTVIPGINDAHVHVGPRPPVHDVPMPDEPATAQVEAALRDANASAPAGVALQLQVGGRVLDDAAVDRAWLDARVSTRAVKLYSYTGHGTIVNSAWLARIGVTDSIADPEGGWFGRDRSGRLNGRVHEYAEILIGQRLNALVTADSDRREPYRRFATEATGLGITSVQLMGNAGPHRQIVADVVAIQSPLRWRILRWPWAEPGQETHDSKTHLPPQPSPRVDARGMKWMLDGTPIERLAAVTAPYADRPDENGRLNLPAERLAEFVGWAYGSEDPLAVHAVGDRAIAAYFDALDRGGRPEIWQRKRPRLEHGDMLTPELMARAKTLGVVVVQNPAHLMLAEAMSTRLGPERMQTIQPMKALLDAGVPLALGSDGPLSPFLNIMFATMHPARPAEALSREQAVIAYTRGAAFAEFTEREKGQLAVGMLADLAVLSADLFTVPADQLPAMTSVFTIIGGQVVHDSGVVR